MDRFDESFHSCPMDRSETNLTIGRIFTAYTLALGTHQDLFTNLTIRVRWMDSSNLFIRVRWTNPTNLTIGRIFTTYLSLTNALTVIHQSYHSCPMNKSDESNHLCSMDRTRPVLISFPCYCGTKFTNRTDGVDSTVLDNPHSDTQIHFAQTKTLPL